MVDERLGERVGGDGLALEVEFAVAIDADDPKETAPSR